MLTPLSLNFGSRIQVAEVLDPQGRDITLPTAKKLKNALIGVRPYGYGQPCYQWGEGIRNLFQLKDNDYFDNPMVTDVQTQGNYSGPKRFTTFLTTGQSTLEGIPKDKPASPDFIVKMEYDPETDTIPQLCLISCNPNAFSSTTLQTGIWSKKTDLSVEQRIAPKFLPPPEEV